MLACNNMNIYKYGQSNAHCLWFDCFLKCNHINLLLKLLKAWICSKDEIIVFTKTLLSLRYYKINSFSGSAPGEKGCIYNVNFFHLVVQFKVLFAEQQDLLEQVQYYSCIRNCKEG